MAGRGRGLGRGRGIVVESPWMVTEKRSHEEVKQKMIQMASAVEEDFQSSDDEEIYTDDIYSKTMKEYKMKNDGDVKENQFLVDILQTGNISCLICIESVKRTEAIWSCKNCKCIFHLPCIQKWAREGIGRCNLEAFEEEKVDKKFLNWHCPKCRFEYKNYECPSKYECFCGKVQDPPFDPWIIPHSCGQKCLQPLKPECGHICVLLCHPGPCPDCPMTVNSSCYCGQSAAKLQRCSNKEWSCGRPCGKLNTCGIHKCEEFCHKGDCPPCPKTSKQFCMCGKKTETKPCTENQWSCHQKCGKALSCEHHLCEKECHSGTCDDCPRTGERTCPCGKTASKLACTEDVPACEDTCGKEMLCRRHTCAKRCHYGPCETCTQVLTKTCRCGRKKKELPCSKDFLCEYKCTSIKSCGRHACKKKCCDGNCPPCDQVCNRALNCRNHKCPSPCHTGSCYPCYATKQVSCFCGNVKLTVPCGKEKTAKPPKCKQLCKLLSTCHHEKQTEHRCHYRNCPPCKQTCGKELACSHTCSMACHDRVPDHNAKREQVMKKMKTQDVFIQQPCGPCTFPIQRSCLGKHTVREFACSVVEDFSCAQECGRQLACGNHSCQKECHHVKGKPPPNTAGRNCNECEEVCLKERPIGCIHECKLPCHPGECPKCETHLKLNCHCATLNMYIKCCEYNAATKDQLRELLCCKARCTKQLSCGHLCSKICHADKCSKPSECVDKTPIRCPCTRKKKSFACKEVQAGEAMLECDEKCMEVKEKKQSAVSCKEAEEMMMKLQQQQEELEKYERKKQGRKPRKRKPSHGDPEEKTFLHKYKFIIFLVFTLLLTGCVILYIQL